MDTGLSSSVDGHAVGHSCIYRKSEVFLKPCNCDKL